MGDKYAGIWLWIIYKKGKKNVVVDEISRKYEDVEALLYPISIIQSDWIAEEMDE